MLSKDQAEVAAANLLPKAKPREITLREATRHVQRQWPLIAVVAVWLIVCAGLLIEGVAERYVLVVITFGAVAVGVLRHRLARAYIKKQGQRF